MAGGAYDFVTYNATAGAAEDVLDVITQVSPEETPFLSRLAIGRAFAKYHEWLSDSLDSATATGGAVAEGDIPSNKALTARTRVGNYCQISQYTFGISGTQQAINSYGVDSEYAYQLERAMKIVKIWMENILLFSTTSTGGMGTVCATGARALRGMIDSVQTSRLTGSGNACSLTEGKFNDILATIFDAGGNPNVAYTGGYNKRRISSFATSNTRFIDPGAKGVLRNYITLYESDFGAIEIVLDRYMSAGTVPIVQQDKWKLAYLRKPTVTPLAKDGDRTRAMIVTEYTLENLNEKSGGLLSAFATSAG